MTGWVGAVFIASLVGSTHCVAMCGPLMACGLVGGGPAGAAVPWRRQVAYHGGRAIGYVLLGILAGAFGATLDLGGRLFGLQRAATVVAAVCLIVYGVLLLLRRGRPGSNPAATRLIGGLFRRAMPAAARRSGAARATAVGLLSAALPCGWLWAYVAVAAGSAHPVRGAVVMAVFWAGTVPLLAALGLGVQRLAGPFARALPTVSALLLVAAGTWALAHRMDIPSPGGASSVRTASAQTTAADEGGPTPRTDAFDPQRAVEEMEAPSCHQPSP